MSLVRKTRFEAIKCTSAADAIETAAAMGWNAISLSELFFAIAEDQSDKLAAAGEYFAYLCDDNGKIVTIPVN